MPSSITKPVFGGSDSTQNSNSSGISAGQNANLGFGINGNYGVNQSANQSAGGSQSSGSSFNQSTQDVWAGQSPYLQDVYGQAGNAFHAGMNEVNGMKPMVQGSMGNALGQAQGAYGNQMGGGFSQALAGQVGPNAYTNALKGQIADDAQKLKQQNLGSLDARAAAAGMSGSSGYRDQTSDMMSQVDENALNQMAQLDYNAYNQGVQNQMQLAGQMDQNQQFGVGNLQNLQAGAMNMFNPSLVNQQMAQNYAQTIGGPTVLGNSMGGSNNMSNSFNMSNGFSNGFNAGVGMNGSLGFGNQYGSNVSSGSGMTDTHTGIVPGIAQGYAAHKMGG